MPPAWSLIPLPAFAIIPTATTNSLLASGPQADDQVLGTTTLEHPPPFYLPPAETEATRSSNAQTTPSPSIASHVRDDWSLATTPSIPGLAGVDAALEDPSPTRSALNTEAEIATNRVQDDHGRTSPGWPARLRHPRPVRTQNLSFLRSPEAAEPTQSPAPTEP
jgi:hypothetical protein